MQLKKKNTLFSSLFSHVNGCELSRKARIHKDAIEYTYGEIEFIPFVALLSQIPLHSESVLYDLGSGTGKAVLACALIFPIKKYVGIEIFQELHQSSLEQLNRLLSYPIPHIKNAIFFFHGDFLEYDLTEATVVFINASTMIGSTWDKLNQHVSRFPNISHVITTTKPLHIDTFEVYKSTHMLVSWGVVQVFIHVRSKNGYSTS